MCFCTNRVSIFVFLPSFRIDRDSLQLAQSKAPANRPITPSPTPTWLDTAPAVGNVVDETAATEEVEVNVATGPDPDVLGLDAVLPPGGGELTPVAPLGEEGGAGGGMIVVAEIAEDVMVDGEGPVTAPVEAVLLSLSAVHKVVVAVPTMVVAVPLPVPVVASDLDEVEA